ncbi:MAG: sugar porter family MFS transporter [Dysgonamonadaceae bacterium]|jgi:sugar porter (SP) family MFS transporter|nr:sugar porter family MFS transporter [Dysgonamonadaceae bacterium]
MQEFNAKYMLFLSAVAALGGFLFGYDTAVISGTISQVVAQFSLDSMQQGWYVGCALIGSIAGVAVAGYLSDNLGRKYTMLLSAVLFTVSAVGCTVCNNMMELDIYRIIGGAGIGIVSIVSPLYISEVSAAKNRGSMVILYQLAITVGFLFAYLVNYALLGFADNAANLPSPALVKIFHTEVWRGMLGMETLPALLFFLIIFFIPDSPRWLILKKREEKAKLTLLRIFGAEKIVEKEFKATKEAASKEIKSEWSALLRPDILKAIIVGSSIAILGQFMGVNAVLYYGPTIFEENGLSSGDSLFYQVMVGLANTIATVIAIWLIDRAGRKKLIYWGVSAMIIFLLLIAFFFLWGKDIGLPPVTLLVFFMAYVFSCAISICAVIFVLLSEMYPIKVRGLAMSIAGLSLWVGTYLVGQLTPWLLETLQPAGTFTLFALVCVPYMLIMWRCVPDTKGKSLEEIEKMWEKTE